ncbi:MAG: ParB N-terminal domain-containing protein, partial [Lachnospiraceae bacterium]
MAKPKLNLDDFADMLKFDSEPESDPQKETMNFGYMEMDLDKMLPFPEHKFKLYEGQRLQDMADSIKQFGILLPFILWHKDDQYIILSGHNRKNAALLA